MANLKPGPSLSLSHPPEHSLYSVGSHYILSMPGLHEKVGAYELEFPSRKTWEMLVVEISVYTLLSPFIGMLEVRVSWESIEERLAWVSGIFGQRRGSLKF